MGMTIQRMIELLQIEHECMLRVAHDDCERNCADCNLVQDDGELHEMYTDVIALLEKQKPKPVKVTKNAYNYEFYNCPNCDRGFELTYYKRPTYCDKCGQAVKWNAETST